jgi:hypothetical protein
MTKSTAAAQGNPVRSTPVTASDYAASEEAIRELLLVQG